MFSWWVIQAFHAHRRLYCYIHIHIPTNDRQNDCTLLEGSFLWAEAAGVVRRVCVVGRKSKLGRSRGILNNLRNNDCGGGGTESRPIGASSTTPKPHPPSPSSYCASSSKDHPSPAPKNRKRDNNASHGKTVCESVENRTLRKTAEKKTQVPMYS